MSALYEANVNTDEKGPVGTLKSVIFIRPSSFGLAKGRNHRGFSARLSMHKGFLLKVVIFHGSRRSGTP
jgi:hypothetical protein